ANLGQVVAGRVECSIELGAEVLATDDKRAAARGADEGREIAHERTQFESACALAGDGRTAAGHVEGRVRAALAARESEEARTGRDKDGPGVTVELRRAAPRPGFIVIDDHRQVAGGGEVARDRQIFAARTVEGRVRFSDDWVCQRHSRQAQIAPAEYHRAR